MTDPARPQWEHTDDGITRLVPTAFERWSVLVAARRLGDPVVTLRLQIDHDDATPSMPLRVELDPETARHLIARLSAAVSAIDPGPDSAPQDRPPPAHSAAAQQTADRASELPGEDALRTTLRKPVREEIALERHERETDAAARIEAGILRRRSAQP